MMLRRRPSLGAMDNAWLLLFGDLLALLVAFFVLIYSMSAMRADSWHQLRKALSQEFFAPSPQETEQTQAQPSKPASGAAIGFVRNIIEAQRYQYPLLIEAQLIERDAELSIVIPAKLLLDAQGRVADGNEGQLADIAAMLMRFDNAVEIRASAKDWRRGVMAADQLGRALAASGYTRALPVSAEPPGPNENLNIVIRDY